jgi:osmotically-inducible protein OsmY
MKLAIASLFTCSILLLPGCGNFLATMETDTIEDDPGERTLGQMLEDDNIETKAIVNIHAADTSFDDAHVVVVSYNGFVLLAGQVSDEALKAQATTVVRKIHGVRRIYNEMEVAAPSSGMKRTSDAWITAKVKAWLVGSPSINGSRVKVVTENGVVYLMGLTTTTGADLISDKAASISGVQRVVRLLEILD